MGAKPDEETNTVLRCANMHWQFNAIFRSLWEITTPDIDNILVR